MGVGFTAYTCETVDRVNNSVVLVMISRLVYGVCVGKDAVPCLFFSFHTILIALLASKWVVLVYVGIVFCFSLGDLFLVEHYLRCFSSGYLMPGLLLISPVVIMTFSRIKLFNKTFECSSRGHVLTLSYDALRR